MTKDTRVIAVRQLIENGSYTKYLEIFNLLPLTAIINVLKTNHARLIKYNADPGMFRMNDIFKIAKYLEIPETKMYELVYNQVLENRKKKKPSKKE